MKKIICTLLAVMMVISIAAVGVSVYADTAEVGKVAQDYTPAGTPINSADDFAGMAADGNYYLNADITVSASYASAFTGTFDGNGHTVTTTAPLFADLAGTVKNLTVAGEITVSDANAANIALTTSGNVTFENIVTKANIAGATRAGAFIADTPGNKTTITIKNCVNNANITTSDHAAGFVARVDGICTILVENCENTGNLTSTTSYAAGIATLIGNDSLSTADAALVSCTVRNSVNNGAISGKSKNCAGIIGYSLGDIKIENCVNKGNITNETENAAGILGSSAYQTLKGATTIIGCENYGTITAAKKAGGISAYFGRHNAISGKQHSMENCANYGDIYLYASGTQSDGCQAAGIAARTYTTVVGNSNSIKNCINFGNITVDMTNGPDTTNVAGIIAYCNQAKYIFENNVNLGNITVTNGSVANSASTVILRSTSSDPTCTVNNYGIAIEGIPVAVASTADYTFTDAMVKTVNADQIASGELVYMLNEAAGATVYYQDLATGKITLKAAADGSNTVIKNADGTYSNPVKEPETPSTPPTSDNGMMLIAVALVGVANVGIAFVVVQIKKKEN